jgi:hypothetical protein
MRLAYPEILSALNRKQKSRGFSTPILGVLIMVFEPDGKKEDVVFACADAGLLDAARAERLVAYDPE